MPIVISELFKQIEEQRKEVHSDYCSNLVRTLSERIKDILKAE